MLTPIAELLQSSPTLWIFVTILLGLLVGSFLNVVIHRLPLMMDRDWKEQYRELMNEPRKASESQVPEISLSSPPSHCPNCKYRIKPWENVPVVSYLFLRGQCSNCQSTISMRYPLIELATGLLSGIVAWHFGFGWPAAAALVLTWSLLCLSMIDFDHQLLPDSITLPLLWMGLTLSLFPIFADTHASIVGALAGYLCLWLVFQVFKLLTGKEGMGYGDFKLLAALGAWMGWSALPLVVLLSSAVGAVVGIALVVMVGRDRQIPIPFGPYLAAAGWLALLWGDQMTASYLRWAGL